MLRVRDSALRRRGRSIVVASLQTVRQQSASFVA
jgi:hypothetical protein